PTAACRTARVSAQAKNAKKLAGVPATGRDATCCLPRVRRSSHGDSVVPSAVRRCVACSIVKRGGDSDADVGCGGRVGGGGGGRAARNDVFCSRGRAARSVASPGVVVGRGRSGVVSLA